MPDCKVCENKKWKDMYMAAQQRFDKVLINLTVGFVILITVVIFCLVVTICTLIRTQEFINEFEYVEQTEIQIEQDSKGHNTVILPNGDEVKTNGAEIYREDKKILEEEENKINTINVFK